MVFFIIFQGYLAGNLQAQALTDLGKRLMSVVEELTRNLESLDALTLGESATDVRQHRKTIVTKVQVSIINIFFKKRLFAVIRKISNRLTL